MNEQQLKDHHLWSRQVLALAQEGVSQAIERHRRLKQPIVVVEDGRIVWKRPEEIPPRALPGDDEPLPPDIPLSS
jgi:hypothetical protein